jgi:endonuclease/exonuclease/phosphatase family metal-dependent hydrolase
MRLLSWNVQWCRGIDGRVDPSRIAAQVRREDPDVICLQEIATNFAELPGSAGEDQAHALMDALPGYEGCLASGVDVPASAGGRARFGNLILSRLPLGRVLRHSLPWPPAPDVPSMPRVAVEAVVQTNFGPLRIITTHLEYYSHEHRAAQIGRLRALHAEACSPRKPVEKPGPFRSLPRPASAIVCGDFNLPPADPLHAVFKNPFAPGIPKFLDAWEAVHPGQPHPHTFHVFERDEGDPPYCCDYAFVTEDLAPRLASVRIDAETQASDHQPVIVELR